jgi:hypothetical protein
MICSVCYHPSILCTFFSDYMIALMKHNKTWYCDITFNMWTGFVCSVVFKNSHFDKFFTGFTYLHQSLEKGDHIEALSHLATALNLSEEAQKQYAIITDGEAPLIKAWLIVFPNIKHLRCSLHFVKNISDKMMYRLPKRPSKEQITAITMLFNGSKTHKGLIDQSPEEVEEGKEKILLFMYVLFIYL